MKNILKLLFISALFTVGHSTAAEEAQWFAVIYGEQHEAAAGMSANSSIENGKFLPDDFVGTEVYVRLQDGYSLSQYRPHNPSNSNSNSVTTSSESAMAADAAAQTQSTSEPTGEFGPLSDSGVNYFVNGDFQGWYCSQLYITPLGGNDYKLRCNETMQRQ